MTTEGQRARHLIVATTYKYENFQIDRVRNHWFVTVPWHRAEDLRSRLQERGIPVTACLEPAERLAGLEIHQEVDPETVRAILAAPPG
jgi:hypothetical protein